MDGVKPSELLSQLEHILESDPLIDEVGFIHPSQIAMLNEEASSSPSSSSGVQPQSADGISKSETSGGKTSNMFFWNREHKLGISTFVLRPLYDTAKDAFMAALKQYKMANALPIQKDEAQNEKASMCPTSSLSISELDVMKHSKALLLLSCDFGTAWNARKLIVSKKQHLPAFMDELLLSALILSYSPKSERAWNQRKWAIKMLSANCSHLPEILERESKLVKKIAENSKMNYRAWNHRCWLVSYMSESQVGHELQKSRDWSGLHIADNSCFHYRARLLLRMLENSQHNQDPESQSHATLKQVWEEELHWVEKLIHRYVGRESLWLHRRFLSLVWIKHLATDSENASSRLNNKIDTTCDIHTFIDNEVKLFESCTTIPDNAFEDYSAQAIFSTTYILWLAKQMPDSYQIELQKVVQDLAFKALLNSLCPGKSFLLDFVVGHMNEGRRMT